MKMHTLVSLFVLSCCFLVALVNASKASCKDPYYGKCYGIPLGCPPGCPKLCEIDCKACKPYCACDKPGAICQDPRFIGGDGVMFYFHGKKDKDFCLISDPKIHVNAHFIGKKSKKGRDFTWVQAIALLYKGHKLYIGAKNVSHWQDTNDNMLIHFDGEIVQIPFGKTREWRSPKAGIIVKRAAMMNVLEVEVLELMKMKVRVVPITMEESRVHGYDISEDGDCFAHLELGFKFESLSGDVNGVLGQTYASGYRSRVKIGVAMPIMGGAERFQTSNIFSADCVASRFGLERSI